MKHTKQTQRTRLRELTSGDPRPLSSAALRMVGGGTPEGTHDYGTSTSHWDNVRPIQE